MISQCIPRPPKAQAQENFSLPVVSRSSLHSKSVMCSTLTLIHAHQAERIHQPWPKLLRVKNSAASNRSTRRAGVRGGAYAGRPRCVRILVCPGESVFFEFLLAALIQKHECERLLMSEYANVR